MGRQIIAAAAGVGVMIVARIALVVLVAMGGGGVTVNTVYPVVVAVLILVMILKGHRLAWQWGRIFGLIGAVWLTLASGILLLQVPGNPEVLLGSIVLGMQGIPLFFVFFALGSPEAKEYFRLICPSCSVSEPKGGDFFYNKAICKQCGTTW